MTSQEEKLKQTVNLHNKVTESMKQQIRDLLTVNTVREVAALTGLPKSTVHSWTR